MRTDNCMNWNKLRLILLVGCVMQLGAGNSAGDFVVGAFAGNSQDTGQGLVSIQNVGSNSRENHVVAHEETYQKQILTADKRADLSQYPNNSIKYELAAKMNFTQKSMSCSACHSTNGCRPNTTSHQADCLACHDK